MSRFAYAFLLFTLSACAQMKVVPAAPPKDNPLKPLEYLVGGTWVAEGDYPGTGHYTAERTYHWMLNRNFIEQNNVIKVGATTIEVKRIYGWDSQKNKLAAWGFGDDGGIATVEADPTETEISFEGTRSGGGGFSPLRFTLKKLNDNEFTEATETKKDGPWLPLMTFHFTRK
jgi:hypothetical protein